MKINRKALKLIDKGLSSKTVSKLTESQIDTLYSRMISEQTMVSKTDTATINKLKTEKKPFQVYEKELEEDDTLNVVNDPDATEDGMGIFEKDYKDGPNPWAICHAQVGPKKTRKFERCVMSVKKQLKEGKNPLSLFLETQIEKIVEKHIPPRITKSDLLKIVKESTKGSEPSKPGIAPTYPKPGPTKKQDTKEQATAPAPAKPATEPTTRPNTTPKEKPFSPGKNPAPAVKPAPKAGKISPETAKEKVIDIIMNILEK
jgi:hypothetical protein